MFRPTHSAIRGFPKSQSSAPKTCGVQYRRPSLRPSGNSQRTCSLYAGTPSAIVDWTDPCQAEVGRLPDALTVELRIEVRRPFRICDYCKRPEVTAVEIVYEIDARRCDVDPSASAITRLNRKATGEISANAARILFDKPCQPVRPQFMDASWSRPYIVSDIVYSWKALAWHAGIVAARVRLVHTA